MKILVVGATGATGRLVVDELLGRGHEVTALVRRPGCAAQRVVVGDVTDPTAVDAAVAGQDAVVVTLGIRENALLVRLLGSRRTPIDVRSRGTRHLVEAMRRHGVPRLVVQTTYGAGDSWPGLSPSWKLIFSAVLRPQLADTERQEAIVRDSGLDWVLVRPVALVDGPGDPPFVSPGGEVAGMRVPRRAVARVLVDAAEGDPAHRILAVSAARAPRRRHGAACPSH